MREFSARTIRRLMLVATATLAIVVSCTGPFNLAELLDGPDGKPLSIAPNAGVLAVNQSVQLVVAGGHPPYRFSITGVGALEGDVYRAHLISGSATVTVHDAVESVAAAQFIVNADVISVGIAPSVQTVLTGGAAQLTAFGGAEPYWFELEQNESDAYVDDVTGGYIAGNQAGTDVVTVNDVHGSTAQAVITVMAKHFSVSPFAASVYTGQEIELVVVGGDGPFTFSVEGDSGATIDGISRYVAGPTSGVDTISVIDEYDGRETFATVTVNEPSLVTNVDYAPGPVANFVGGLTGDPFTADGTIENLGSAGGTEDVRWTVYASADTTIGGNDFVVAAGVIPGGLPAGGLLPITMAGNWPPVAGDYYLGMAVAAADDLDAANDVSWSAGTATVRNPASISPTVAAVYTGQEIAFSATGTSPFSFSLQTDESGGSIHPLTGLYIAGPNPGLDVIRMTDADSRTVAADVTVVIPPLSTAVDYEVLSVNVIGGSTAAGGAVSGDFDLRNAGTAAGGYSVSWTIFASLEPTVGGGATVVASGTATQLPAGSSATVPFSGTWPGDPGSYYVIATVSAPDDPITANNAAATGTAVVVSLPPPLDVDYLVSVAPPGGSRGISTVMNEDFTIANVGQDDGSATLSWTAYLSNDPNFSADDLVVASGSIAGGLAAGASTTRSITGTWPDASGVRYLIVRLTASDDTYTDNNIVSSAAYFIEDPAILDYVPSDLSMRYPIVTTGSPISETFTVANVGGEDGAETITWIAYASFGTSPDPLDEVGRGELAPLSGGTAVAGITAAGSWPATPGDYYLIVEVDAPDEANRGDYVVSSETFRVNDPPDYRFEAVSFPVADYGGHPEDRLEEASGRHGGPTTHSFEIVEVNGATGQQSIQWFLYQSDDAILSAGDPLVQSGVIPPLSAWGTTGTITLPPWLEVSDTPGRYYYILKLAAGDDGNASNDTYLIGPVDVWEADDPILNVSETSASSYYDYFIRLNQGQTVRIAGRTNESMSFDAYYISVGPNVSQFQMHLEWATNADLDLYFYSVDPDEFIDKSFDGGGLSEPYDGTFDVPVAPGHRYRIEVATFDDQNQVGQEYILTIQAAPWP